MVRTGSRWGSGSRGSGLGTRGLKFPWSPRPSFLDGFRCDFPASVVGSARPTRSTQPPGDRRFRRAPALPPAKGDPSCTDRCDRRPAVFVDQGERRTGNFLRLRDAKPFMIPFARTLNGRTGHTSPVNVAGWPGSRTYRRACSATQWFEPHLSGIIEIALWRSVLSAVSMLGPLMSHELR